MPTTLSLEERWLRLFDITQRQKAEIEFYKLCDLYAQPHRRYHTLKHISDSLNLFEEIKKRIHDPYTFELALWFHDIIYQTDNKDNEARSAVYAQETLQNLGLEKDQIDTIAHYILLTKHPSQPNTDDEKYLLDIDLSILGESPVIYDKYTQAIREEYKNIPDDIYAKGRTKVLRAFLAQTSIYHTDYFKEKYEDQALANIHNELDSLLKK